MKRRERPIPDYKARRLAREQQREVQRIAAVYREFAERLALMGPAFTWAQMSEPTAWPELH